MRIIILSAGQGTRLRPLTNNIPKCMVKLDGKPLIQYQLDIFQKHKIKDINIVTGYLEEKINFQGVKKFYNLDYASSNMVYTLFCAKEIFDGSEDILISYGDIIYNNKVFESIKKANNEINVVVDRKWKKYWEARMEDPLKDAETLKIDENGYIKEIGKKPNTYNDIEAQYIGLIKIRKDVVSRIKQCYENLDKNKNYDGKNYKNIYMTSFLQVISDTLYPLTPIYINNGWMEIDEPSDLQFKSFLKI